MIIGQTIKNGMVTTHYDHTQAKWVWDNSDYNGRLATAKACGWAPRTASKFARMPWDKLPIAAQNVLSRYIR